MAKTKTLRVHTLAKELGVASKEIIAKCHAEGIELKNHMSAIQIGLAESIREWFTVGDDVSTVEVATRVDLEKVKRPRRKAAKEATEAPVLEPAGSLATDVAEPPAPPPDVGVSPIETEIAVAPLQAPNGTEPLEERPAAQVEVLDPDKTTVTKPPELAPPPPTEPLVPAGPQLVPKPADLQGPRVVRVEAPEPERRVRPRPRPATGIEPRVQPGPAGPPDVSGPARSRRGHRGVRESSPAARARSPRRHGNASEVSAERLAEWRDQDLIERKERLASATGHGLRARRSAERRRQASAGSAVPAARKSEVEITVPIMIKEFCAAIGTPFNLVGKKLMEQTGRFHPINDIIDGETAELVALEFGVTLTLKQQQSALEQLKAQVAALERNNAVHRPPVVAMLGHVDHGKTSLLDAIRTTEVAKGEAGGITQHIGAYRIDCDDWHVTFLDTPGHEAFTSMRARGADLTDVVVLVVAADDGVMPQTQEAINHAKAAGVEIVVALNKMDLPNVDLNKVYGQLAEHDLAPTEWGGSTDVVKTSALKGEGIDELLEHLSTLSEALDLTADPTVPAQATVIEARMREGRGIVAQVLVREGTLEPGQIVVCGPAAGRVRSLLDDRGKRVGAVGPGTPIEVLGLDELPATGDILYAVKNLSDAKRIAAEIKTERREQTLQHIHKPQTLEDLLRSAGEEEIPELNVIVRADNQGSLEAVGGKLREFPADKVSLRILHEGVGAISEADVALAQVSKAVVIGFHVVAEDRAKRLAEQSGVDLRVYRVIYEIIEDMQKALEGLLAPNQVEERRGKAEVREVFNLSRGGRIAGCYVNDGVINRAHRVRLIRDGRIITEGNALASLRRFKDDAREVRSGLECGIKIANYDDVKVADVIEAYEVIEVAQKL